jgi:carbamoyl-phosphate synthase large subunit
MKLLLTSVGSQVGQHILDVLDYPGFSRRSLVQVVGTNSLPTAACNFRCDRCYLVPLTAAAEYSARMRDILRDESPDLILCCRDEDTYALSQLKSQHPELPGALPVGPPYVALIGLDKWQTWLFARKHRLPFAETFLPRQSGDGAELEAFCRRVGYPLIAKPTRGAASRGVCFVRNPGDAEALAQLGNYLFQEYIGEPRALEAYFATLQGPPPLFAQFTDAGYHASDTIIGPSGDIAPIVVRENRTVFGKTNLSRRIVDATLDALMLDYARALFLEGGTGPMNVQLRQNRDGVWNAVEINLRTNGMLNLLLMGVDQLGFIINTFVPGASFPELRPHNAHRCDQVSREFYSYQIFDTDVSMLKNSGFWSRS